MHHGSQISYRNPRKTSQVWAALVKIIFRVRQNVVCRRLTVVSLIQTCRWYQSTEHNIERCCDDIRNWMAETCLNSKRINWSWGCGLWDKECLSHGGPILLFTLHQQCVLLPDLAASPCLCDNKTQLAFNILNLVFPYFLKYKSKFVITML